MRALWVAIVSGMSLSGCASYDGLAPHDARGEAIRANAVDADGRLTLTELDQLTSVFADNYVARMATACDQVIEGTPEAQDVADSAYLKVVTAVSAYDIASEPDSLSQLFDLVTLVSLQHLVWVEEGGAKEIFDQHAAPIVAAFEASNRDMLELAARAMKPEQIEQIVAETRAWRKINRDLKFVAMIRFEQAAGERAHELENQVRSGGGLMAPVENAVDSLERARRLAERSFYVGKRLPMLVGWQLDHVVNRAMLRKELTGGLQSLERTSTLSESIPGELRELRNLLQTEPRKIIDELASRQQAADKTLATLGDTIAAGAKLVDSTQGATKAADQTIAHAEKVSADLRETLAAADKLLGRLEAAGLSGPNARVSEYAALADKVSGMAKEITAAVKSGDQLMVSAAWQQRLEEVNAAAKERVLQTSAAAESVTNLAFWRVLLAIGALLVAGMVYKTYAVWLTKR
ncbi:MAG TPA: hypothetical protein VF777_09490 [Phycisphaerales bacterium]